ncbi:MAG TPA: M64 family metallopeptidase [Bacteroidales bacterium]|nr:M64 family metallopeptidase [Bacteroidales bacterium]
MRLFISLLLVISALSAGAQFNRYFENATLRFDYFHSGSVEAEYVVPDEMIREGSWAGPRKNLIDPFDYGAFKIMVYDSITGKLIYTRGFSSLFIEYQATEQALTECGNFQESILMPFPKRTVKLEYYSRGKEMVWTRQFETFINPVKDEIRIKPGAGYVTEDILYSGKPKKKLDLVFLPEGYTAAEMDKFRTDCNRFTDFLFQTEPFGEYRKKINIRAVMAPSEESGTDIPTDSVFKNTLLGAGFNTLNTERYLMATDFKIVRDVASAVPYDQIVIMVNSPQYGGGGIYNFYAISTVDNIYSGFVFTHEFGHSFAGLGDEYSDSGSAAGILYLENAEPWEPNITTLADFESKWKDMLPEGTPVPTPATEEFKGKLGVFEGAGYQAKGAYKPYLDCSMNMIRFNNFCPVCQRAMRGMISFYGR